MFDSMFSDVAAHLFALLLTRYCFVLSFHVINPYVLSGLFCVHAFGPVHF